MLFDHFYHFQLTGIARLSDGCWSRGAHRRNVVDRKDVDARSIEARQEAARSAAEGVCPVREAAEQGDLEEGEEGSGEWHSLCYVTDRPNEATVRPQHPSAGGNDEE